MKIENLTIAGLGDRGLPGGPVGADVSVADPLAVHVGDGGLRVLGR